MVRNNNKYITNYKIVYNKFINYISLRELKRTNRELINKKILWTAN